MQLVALSTRARATAVVAPAARAVGGPIPRIDVVVIVAWHGEGQPPVRICGAESHSGQKRRA